MQQKALSLLQFQKKFGTEKACTANVQPYASCLLKYIEYYVCGAKAISVKDNLSTQLKELGFTVSLAQAAPKHLSIQYVSHQFSIYRQPIITPIFKWIDRILPIWAKKFSMTVYSGDMLLLAHV